MTNEEFAILKQNQRQAQGLPRQTKRAVTMSEAELERTCTNMLVLDGWRPLKTNPVSRRARGAGFGELGMADLLVIRYAEPRSRNAEIMWIEFKIPAGINAEHQKRWQQEERERGACVLVFGEDFPATAEDFWRFYCESGWRKNGTPTR